MFSKVDKGEELLAERIEAVRRRTESDRRLAVIGAAATVYGDVECAGALQIFGTVEGDVRSPILVVEFGAHIEGRVFAERLLVCGSIHGAVTATDIGVEATARILGNITHNSLMIAPGALLEGRRPWRPRPVPW
jgi:cytoskeletal protein CcmA (bactofilin family)